MNVLILEPHATGHHANYLRWLVMATQKKKWHAIIATTEDALHHPSLSAITSDFDSVTIHAIRDSAYFIATATRSSQLMRREIVYWTIFKRAVREVQAKMRVDLIILPYLDYCFYALALLGPPFRGIPWCAISMRLSICAASTQDRGMPWKWRITKRLLDSPALCALFVINPSVADVPRDWLSQEQFSRLRYLADPAEFAPSTSRGIARAGFGLADDAVVALVFGSIDERKGVDSLIGALTVRSDLDRYVVLLAGKQTAELRSMITAPECARLVAEKRLIVLDRFISDSEVEMLLTASDLVWVGYRSHIYMSGVLVLAGKASLPVVGTAQGEIGRLIARHSIGTLARIENSAEVEYALRAMLDDAARSEMGRRARTLFESHTIENFGAAVMSVADTR